MALFIWVVTFSLICYNDICHRVESIDLESRRIKCESWNYSLLAVDLWPAGVAESYILINNGLR